MICSDGEPMPKKKWGQVVVKKKKKKKKKNRFKSCLLCGL